MVSVEPYVDGDVVMIPKRAEGPEGLVGMGWVPLPRDDPQYRAWIEYLSAKEIKAPRVGRRPGGRS